MKIFLIVFISVISLRLSAQVTEFAPIGAKWWYDQYQLGPMVSFWRYESLKDTVINGYPLRQISKTQIYNDHLYGSYFYLYNDTAKISIYDTLNNILRPYFDFNAQVGDSVYTLCELYYDCYIVSIVDSINETSINGTPLKQFFTHKVIDPGYDMGGIYIELIGNSYYFFPGFGAYDPVEGGALRCYEDSTLGMYKKYEETDCEYIPTSVSDIYNSILEVYPNPSFDKIHLKINANALITIRVTDITGNEMILNMVKDNSGLYSVDISFLSSGIYFATIYADDKIIGTQKIIKQ